MATLTHQERRDRREKAARDIERGMKPETVCRRHNIGFKSLRDACAEFGVDFPSQRKQSAKAK
jgi:hypothetical protein